MGDATTRTNDRVSRPRLVILPLLAARLASHVKPDLLNDVIRAVEQSACG